MIFAKGYDYSNPNDLTHATLAALRAVADVQEIAEGANAYPYGVGTYGRFALNENRDVFVQAGWDIRGNAAISLYAPKGTDVSAVRAALDTLPFHVGMTWY